MSIGKFSVKLVLPVLAASAMLTLMSEDAHAALGITYNAAVNAPTIYAAQAITAATTVTAPQATVYTTDTLAGAHGPQNAAVVFTIPAGLSFTGIPPTPSCTLGGTFNPANETCLNAAVTTTGNQATVTFTYTTTATCAPCFLNIGLSRFQFTNATSLTSPTVTPLNITAATSDPVLQAVNETTNNAAFAAAVSALVFNAGGPGNPLSIDAASTTVLGTQFRANGVDSATGDVGSLTVGLAFANDATGIKQFTFGNGATIVLSGNFNHITSNSSFLAKSGQNNCTSAASSPASGTVGSGTVTFAAVPVPTTVSNSVFEVCLVADGKGLIGSNPLGVPANASVGTGTSQNVTLNAYNYNGGVTFLNYSGIFPPHVAYLRVVNNSGAPATVTAVIQTEGGSPGIGTVVANLPSNNNVLVPLQSVITAAGSSFTPDSTGRLSLIALANTPFVTVTQLLQNPAGAGTITSIP